MKDFKRSKQSNRVLLVSLAALLLFTVGGTVAYLFMATKPVVNTFTPAKIETVQQSDGTIKNTGDVAVYVRAAVVATWADGDNIYGQAPKHTVTGVGEGSKWVQKGDFYYWSERLAAGASTTPIGAAVDSSETAPEGYKFTVEVATQTIQADPKTAVDEAWANHPY